MKGKPDAGRDLRISVSRDRQPESRDFVRQTWVYLEEFDSAPEENTFQMYFALVSMMQMGIPGFNSLKYVVWYGFNKNE